MGSSKYNKILTVVLIIVIIAVIGLLVFLGIDVYKKYYTEKEVENVLSQFESQISNNISNEPVQENIVTNNEVSSPNININDIFSNTDNTDNNNTSNGSSGNSSSGSTVKYKGFDVIGTIKIPAIDIEYPILDQVSLRALETSIGRVYPENSKLNEIGNSVLVGHNYKNGTFFSDNKKLKNGDKIYITDEDGDRVTYVVYRKYETSDSDFEYATRDVNGKREISLSTCTDDSKRRLIIWAVEQ